MAVFPKQNILVTGGAGYIGSHTVAALLEQGHTPIIADNLSRGHCEATQGAILLTGDLRDAAFVRGIFKKYAIGAVIHFAADSQVGESMVDPLKYYNNNLAAGLTLLTCMKEAGVQQIVFSSSAATYGEPEHVPILETDRALPANPYGETKLAFEKCLKWADAAYGIRHVILRYFNAAGAHPGGMIGEDHTPETHLVPLVLQVGLGQRKAIAVFGNDYPTKDGTCIRDYIHVCDLADAHLCALARLQEGMESTICNLGNGTGFSVLEVIAAARRITGHAIPTEISPRRAGDPAVLIASSQKARDVLAWKPRLNSLETIIETAWHWHRQHPNGYR